MNDTASAGKLSLQRPPARQRAKRRGLRWIAGALALLLLAWILWRYAWPHPAETYSAIRAPYEQTVSGPATLDAINKANVSSRISGKLTRLLVDRNARVSAGQPVAVIEQDDLRSKVSVSRANLLAAQGAQREAEANLGGARAALANARATFDRQAELRANGWVSRASYDQAQTSLIQSEAQLGGIQQTIGRTRAQADAAAANLEVDQAQLAMATVRAPFAGVVAVRNRSLGDIISAGTSIMDIVDPTSIVLTTRLDESVIALVHAGLPARIRFIANPDQILTGRVLRLSREVDPETREFTVDVVVDRLPENWALGQRANVEILHSTGAAGITIPVSFIMRDGKTASVWVVDGGRTHRREIEVATSNGSLAVVSKGLASGSIVVAPQAIYAGMRVVRKEASAP